MLPCSFKILNIISDSKIIITYLKNKYDNTFLIVNNAFTKKCKVIIFPVKRHKF